MADAADVASHALGENAARGGGGVAVAGGDAATTRRSGVTAPFSTRRQAGGAAAASDTSKLASDASSPSSESSSESSTVSSWRLLGSPTPISDAMDAAAAASRSDNPMADRVARPTNSEQSWARLAKAESATTQEMFGSRSAAASIDATAPMDLPHKATRSKPSARRAYAATAATSRASRSPNVTWSPADAPEPPQSMASVAQPSRQATRKHCVTSARQLEFPWQ
mmetsp:Transcript_18258/g.56181  ORF Transcript_18258/g.56181 Transcript_18258/m.56181 type:complete len:225 (-) Transcript_18258:90-764(-)